ncbi:MAG: ribosome small subunit-dependent GTPase A [Bacillota bacterium]
MPTGRVIASHSNFYEVQVGGAVYRCRPRGRFKLEGTRVLAGDMVVFRESGAGEGYIEVVEPRRVELTRPPIANVDQAVVVFTLVQPDKNYALVDRFLVMAENKGLTVILCLNKCDLVPEDEVSESVRYYRAAGYEVIPVSARAAINLDDLRRALAGKVSVLAGQSGVGKSTILNRVVPGAELVTGGLSRKAQRGTHTTRHVSLLDTGGGLVADTPGFTHIELGEIRPNQLAVDFPEFEKHGGKCRFAGCLHDREPGCAVKEAVAAGAIAAERYQHYLDFLGEARDSEKHRY